MSLFLAGAVTMLILLVSPAPDKLTLDVRPMLTTSQWDEVWYTIKGPIKDQWICSGWFYPIVQLHREEWPQRHSCRMVNRHIYQEAWGGPKWPFPHEGEYKAYVKLYLPDGSSVQVMRSFRVVTQYQGGM